MADLAVHDGPIFAFTMVRNSQPVRAVARARRVRGQAGPSQPVVAALPSRTQAQGLGGDNIRLRGSQHSYLAEWEYSVSYDPFFTSPDCSSRTDGCGYMATDLDRRPGNPQPARAGRTFWSLGVTTASAPEKPQRSRATLNDASDRPIHIMSLFHPCIRAAPPVLLPVPATMTIRRELH
jgi:hypothetical protein